MITKNTFFLTLILMCLPAVVSVVALAKSEALCEGRELRVHVARKDQAAAKANIALVLTSHDDLFDKVVHTVQADLADSGQCSVALHYASLPKSKQELENYYAVGYQFVVFLSLSDDRMNIVGRLYDVLDASMLQGKKWKRREPLELWAHKIAQDIWLQLMGNYGSFISKIAYIKKTKGKFGKRITQLCLVDWNSVGEKIVVASPSILVAPSWNHTGELIFCSQFTDRNVRLMATDLGGNSWVVFDRDGTTMGASSISGSSDVVYCNSGEIWKCSYDMKHKKSIHTLLTRAGTMCACPTLLNSGDVIYCAGGKIKQWHANNGTVSLLTEQGYCTGPTYHAPSGRVAYSQKVGKTMQLCIYSLQAHGQTHGRTKASVVATQQITFDAGDKIDASWSPCGTYLAYCLTKGKTSEIMVLNCITGSKRLISPAGHYCSCPAWSPHLSC